MSSWDYWGYKPSRPKAVRNGIKARNVRGAFGTTWWAKRWIAVLESFDIGARLGRGRSYARRGQVLEIHIEPGLVRAKVQGSRTVPYAVTIRLAPFSEEDRAALGAALSLEALLAAKLLAGEMPEGLEERFEHARVPLFPARSQDLATQCSCPDWSNPCKHIAAVYYLMAEEFDRDPFLLLRLRGIEREALPALLGAPKPCPPTASSAPGKTRAQKAQITEAPPAPVPPARVPLPVAPSAFWGAPGPQATLDLPVAGPSQVPEALLKRLGGFPFWRGERPLEEALASSYREAARRGFALLAGENPFAPNEPPMERPALPAGRGTLSVTPPRGARGRKGNAKGGRP